MNAHEKAKRIANGIVDRFGESVNSGNTKDIPLGSWIAQALIDERKAAIEDAARVVVLHCEDPNTCACDGALTWKAIRALAEDGSK